MAEASISVLHDQFSCPICLDLLKDPVAIPCGHSYCMGCIKGYWDQDDHTGVYSCPQCRQTFTPRPVLGRNTILAEVVEKLKKTGLQAAPPAQSYAGPGDVSCDVCTGRKLKAIKSCLVCLASYCETHLQPHYQSPALKKHKLVQATGNLQEKICSHHDKLLEIYCRTDQQCICYLCTMDEHRGHDTVSAAAERTEKQELLKATQRKSQQRIQEREKELQDLRQAVQSLTCSAQAAVKDSERIFTELIRSIERRRSEVKELIRDQEKAAVSRAEGLLERLEQEIAELRRRDAELEQLSHTEDHIHFLQSCQSVCAPPGPGDLPRITVSPHLSFEAVRKWVSQLKERLEDICKEEFVKISQSEWEEEILQEMRRGEETTIADATDSDSDSAEEDNMSERINFDSFLRGAKRRNKPGSSSHKKNSQKTFGSHGKGGFSFNNMSGFTFGKETPEVPDFWEEAEFPFGNLPKNHFNMMFGKNETPGASGFWEEEGFSFLNNPNDPISQFFGKKETPEAARFWEQKGFTFGNLPKDPAKFRFASKGPKKHP